MSKAVLDTDILSEILKTRDSVVATRAATYRKVHGRYTFTVVLVLEIVRGLRRASARAKLDAYLVSLPHDEVLPFDVQSAVIAGEIDASLGKSGRPIGIADVIVASIALRHGLTVVTGNEVHYEYIRATGQPLVIENWRHE